MNYYEHHLGDWAKKCSHLTFAEEGAYRRLLDWYYSNERPLPLDPRTVRRIARCTNSTERRIVDKVLGEFFEPMDDGYHQARVDKELETFSKRLPVTLAAKENMRDRAQRAREKRSALFRLLTEHGLDAPWNATNNALYEVLAENGISVPATAPRTAPRTAQGTASQAPSTNTPLAVTATFLSNGGARLEPQQAAAAATERRAECARAVKRAGLTSVNPLDPRFMALIDAGGTPSEFAVIATEAAIKGKGWAWFLATVKGRREDAARAAQAPTPPAMPQEAPQTYRQRAAAATVQAWVPQLAAKPPA